MLIIFEPGIIRQTNVIQDTLSSDLYSVCSLSVPDPVLALYKAHAQLRYLLSIAEPFTDPPRPHPPPLPATPGMATYVTRAQRRRRRCLCAWGTLIMVLASGLMWAPSNTVRQRLVPWRLAVKTAKGSGTSSQDSAAAQARARCFVFLNSLVARSLGSQWHTLRLMVCVWMSAGSRQQSRPAHHRYRDNVRVH